MLAMIAIRKTLGSNLQLMEKQSQGSLWIERAVQVLWLFSVLERDG
jgi:hypothetical protein